MALAAHYVHLKERKRDGIGSAQRRVGSGEKIRLLTVAVGIRIGYGAFATRGSHILGPDLPLVRVLNKLSARHH